jgi:hypothetical protein
MAADCEGFEVHAAHSVAKLAPGIVRSERIIPKDAPPR